MGFADGGFGFLHFADGFGDVVLGELFGGVLRGLDGSFEVWIGFALVALLLLHFCECLGEFFLLLLELLGEAGGIL